MPSVAFPRSFKLGLLTLGVLTGCATPLPTPDAPCEARVASLPRCDRPAPRVAAPLTVGETATAVVDALCPWNATGVQLEPGAQYRLKATPRPGHEWKDLDNLSDLDTGWQRWRWVGRLVQPWARAPELPMYALVAAQGATHAHLSLAGEAGSLVSVARAGEAPLELFLFANDWPGRYANNQGCLDVTVQRVR